MKEIERKFLVDQSKWKLLKKPEPILITQGYLAKDGDCVVRVRTWNKQGFLTVKSKNTGISRSEYEFEITMLEAKQLLAEFCPKTIRKQRYEIHIGVHTWEVDVFIEPEKKFILAEIELSSENECIEKPDWLLEEVSDDPSYFNSNLV